MMLRWAPARGPGAVHEELVVLGDLLAEEPLLVVPRHADPLEAELCVTMMPSHSPLAILAVRSLRRSRARSSLAATSSLALG